MRSCRITHTSCNRQASSHLLRPVRPELQRWRHATITASAGPSQSRQARVTVPNSDDGSQLELSVACAPDSQLLTVAINKPLGIVLEGALCSRGHHHLVLAMHSMLHMCPEHGWCTFYVLLRHATCTSGLAAEIAVSTCRKGGREVPCHCLVPAQACSSSLVLRHSSCGRCDLPRFVLCPNGPGHLRLPQSSQGASWWRRSLLVATEPRQACRLATCCWPPLPGPR
jgi:hypothetical protein